MERDVPLAPLTTLGVGGPARWFTRAATTADVAAAHQWAVEQRRDLVVLGGGSNLVIADAGIDGLVMRATLRRLAFTADGGDTVVRAGAGERWDALVAAAVERGLAGIECLSGIPGTVGGTPVQNVGAYGQEVAQTIEDVTVFDRATGDVATLSNAECGFAYRMSRFKREDAGRFVVCEVSFRLRPGPPTTTYPDVINYFDRHRLTSPALADARAAILEIRRAKGMVIDASDPDTRSVGSFFMNPVVVAGMAPAGAPGFPAADGRVKIPAAWLIEHAGFARGDAAGRAGLSTKHPLALVNRGGATSGDIVALAVRIKRQVFEQFGIALRPEPVFLGFGNDPAVQYLLKADECRHS